MNKLKNKIELNFRNYEPILAAKMTSKLTSQFNSQLNSLRSIFNDVGISNLQRLF